MADVSVEGLQSVLAGWDLGAGSLAQRLAEALGDLICAGHLPHAAKLPPERALAPALSVSRGTVARAYAELADRGLVERRQGAGTSVRAPRNGEPSTSLRTQGLRRNAVVSGLIERRPDLLDLSAAYWTDEAAPPVELIERASEAIGAAWHGHGYAPLGVPALREAVAEHLTRDRSLPTTPDQVLITAGGQHAITVAAQAILEPGDVALCERYSHAAAFDVLTVLGARVFGVAMGSGGIDPDAFARACAEQRPHLAYLIPTVHNPTGSILGRAEREAVAATLQRHPQLVAIEDEVLAPLWLTRTPPPPPLAALAPGANVIVVGSLSKVAWSGLRIGWIRAPRPLLDPIARVKAVTDLGTSVPSQLLALEVLSDLPEQAAQRRDAARERLDHVLAQIAQRLPEWRAPRPDGGLTVWAELPWGSSTELARIAEQHGVAITSGRVLAVDPRDGDRRVRIPFGRAPAELDDALDRLASAWDDYAGGTTRLRVVV